jgi:Organic solute transporter Ostalpha
VNNTIYSREPHDSVNFFTVNHNTAMNVSFQSHPHTDGVSSSPPSRSSASSSSSFLWACLCRTLQICQTFIVIVLGVAVVYLGYQLHSLQLQVQAEDDKITALQKQVANQHQNQQDLTDRVEQEHSLTLYQMAGTFTLLTCLLTAFHIAQHLSNFHEAVVQRKIIAILWMSPIYSLTSFLSLVFPSADGYLAIVKDFYEAYTVYTFLSFLIAVLGRGNRETAIQVLAQHADHLKAPTKCLSRFYYPPPETSPTAMANAVLMECQILAMQFVLVRPVTSIISFVTDTASHTANSDDNDDDDPYAYFLSQSVVNR